MFFFIYPELFTQYDSESYNSFGLKILQLRIDNNILRNFRCNFFDFKDKWDSGIYSTIMIGPNGTGKSNILRAVVDVFRELNHLKISDERGNYVSGGFFISYLMDGNVYSFGNISFDENKIQILDEKRRKLWAYKNLQEVTYKELPLPNCIVANSIMLTDKFPLLSELDEFSEYKYLGIRRSPSIAGTRTYVRRTVEQIVNSFERENFTESLEKALEFLELERTLFVYYEAKYKHLFFSGSLQPKNFHEYFKNIIDKFSGTDRRPPFKVNHYKKHFENNDALVRKLCDYINVLAESKLERYYDGGRTLYFYFDMLSNEDASRLKESFDLIKHMGSLDIITFPYISLKKKNSEYTLEDSSSGEYHFLASIVGLLAVCESNSLVLIDEPEVSLHPNWQMRYLHFLRELFSEPLYKTCHFIITTHSHFLVSDSRGECTSVIALNRNEKGNVEGNRLPESTFGWSAEEILLTVFNVPTTRNYFVAEKVGNILEMVSKKDRDDEKISKMVKELIESNILLLSDEDPLKPVIDKLVQKYA